MAENYLNLADWRREVAVLYGRIRGAATPEEGWHLFREKRDALYANHGQSPLRAQQRKSFTALNYFSYDPQMRMMGQIANEEKREVYIVELPAEGTLRFTRIAWVSFFVGGLEQRLALYWVEGYGGGLFLPFRDGSNGRGSYGGGRYLYDGIKGADLGSGSKQILLDFNFAYNPSCAYNDNWVCPLAPLENWLDLEIKAGEMAFLS